MATMRQIVVLAVALFLMSSLVNVNFDFYFNNNDLNFNWCEF